MNVYICNSFEGHYPVGAAAVIVAETRYDAKERLEHELKRIGLEQDVEVEDIEPLETILPDVIIVSDGEY